MATFTPEEKLIYVMTVLKNTTLDQPNYHAVATDMGLNSANNAQKRFKAIVESAGFRLVNKQIVPKDRNATNGPSTTPTPARRPATKAKNPAKKAGGNGGRGKKRKAEEVSSDDEQAGVEGKVGDEDDEGVEVTEARVIRDRSTTINTEPAIEEEIEEED